MKKSKFENLSALGHIGAWIILFMIFCMDELEYSGWIISLIYAFASILLFMTVVYTHYYLVFPLFWKGKYVVYFGCTIILISIATICHFAMDYHFEFEYWEEDYWGLDFLYYFILMAMFVGVSSLYYFVEVWFQNIQKESQLKNERLQAELNFLKSQINPHFLFNTLNNIYAYAQTGNEKTAPMLERLSSILRFMVYDCSEDKVELDKELNAVEDLLEIHKMKNSEQRNIKMSVEGVKRFHLVAPLIIVNLVENACKHSDAVSNPKGFIHFKAIVDRENKAVFEISNSIKKYNAKAQKYGGVGLENVRKRLALQYGNNYSIANEQKDNIYYLKVIMPLERKI